MSRPLCWCNDTEVLTQSNKIDRMSTMSIMRVMYEIETMPKRTCNVTCDKIRKRENDAILVRLQALLDFGTVLNKRHISSRLCFVQQNLLK